MARVDQYTLFPSQPMGKSSYHTRIQTNPISTVGNDETEWLSSPSISSWNNDEMIDALLRQINCPKDPVIISDMSNMNCEIKETTRVHEYIQLHSGVKEYLDLVCSTLSLNFPTAKQVISMDPDPDFTDPGLVINVNLPEYPDEFFNKIDEALEEIYKHYPKNAHVFVLSDLKEI